MHPFLADSVTASWWSLRLHAVALSMGGIYSPARLLSRKRAVIVALCKSRYKGTCKGCREHTLYNMSISAVESIYRQSAQQINFKLSTGPIYQNYFNPLPSHLLSFPILSVEPAAHLRPCLYRCRRPVPCLLAGPYAQDVLAGRFGFSPRHRPLQLRGRSGCCALVHRCRLPAPISRRCSTAQAAPVCSAGSSGVAELVARQTRHLMRPSVKQRDEP